MDARAAVVSAQNTRRVDGSTQHNHHDTPSCKRRQGLSSVVAELVVCLTLSVRGNESTAADGGFTTKDMYCTD